MPGLSAKVFRTYNASITMQSELAKLSPKEADKMTVEEKVLFFNRASVQVAILCNHQRSVPKTHAAAMEKLEAKVAELEAEIKAVRKHKKAFESGKKPKVNPDVKMPVSAESCEKKIKSMQLKLCVYFLPL